MKTLYLADQESIEGSQCRLFRGKGLHSLDCESGRRRAITTDKVTQKIPNSPSTHAIPAQGSTNNKFRQLTMTDSDRDFTHRHSSTAHSPFHCSLI